MLPAKYPRCSDCVQQTRLTANPQVRVTRSRSRPGHRPGIALQGGLRFSEVADAVINVTGAERFRSFPPCPEDM